MSERFDDIRPYRDAEVRPVLECLLANPELIEAVVGLRFGHWPSACRPLLRPVVRQVLRRQLRAVNSVRDFQAIVEIYMRRMIETTTTAFTVSGLEHLPPDRPCLFISNHRDIALDPAFVNYALYHNGRDTVRIAIGDNLLTKDYASDLMRLNKSFIVRRSVTGMKALLAASRHLAAYMRFSIQEERHSLWIAQREGRAKDGVDRTEAAVIKMIALAQDRKQEGFADFIRGMHVVPVSISYEYDPCDVMKAHELAQKAHQGSYSKAEHEDIRSIAQGIAGRKGDVHLSFGRMLEAEYADADAVADALDRQIIAGYRLHASNYVAWRRLHGEAGLPAGDDSPQALRAAEAYLDERLALCEPEARPFLLAMYAAPVDSQREQLRDRAA